MATTTTLTPDEKLPKATEEVKQPSPENEPQPKPVPEAKPAQTTQSRETLDHQPEPAPTPPRPAGPDPSAHQLEAAKKNELRPRPKWTGKSALFLLVKNDAKSQKLIRQILKQAEKEGVSIENVIKQIKKMDQPQPQMNPEPGQSEIQRNDPANANNLALNPDASILLVMQETMEEQARQDAANVEAAQNLAAQNQQNIPTPEGELTHGYTDTNIPDGHQREEDADNQQGGKQDNVEEQAEMSIAGIAMLDDLRNQVSTKKDNLDEIVANVAKKAEAASTAAMTPTPSA